MSEIVLIGEDSTVHESWEDAVAHVAAKTEVPRESLWLRPSDGGVFLFAGPPHDCIRRMPVAWVAHPAQFQAAKSRGELENVRDFS